MGLEVGGQFSWQPEDRCRKSEVRVHSRNHGVTRNVRGEKRESNLICKTWYFRYNNVVIIAHSVIAVIIIE